MRSMKKRYLAALLLIVCLLPLAGCGKFECDGCGKETSGKKHKLTILGETATVCDDCYDSMKALEDLFK